MPFLEQLSPIGNSKYIASAISVRKHDIHGTSTLSIKPLKITCFHIISNLFSDLQIICQSKSRSMWERRFDWRGARKCRERRWAPMAKRQANPRTSGSKRRDLLLGEPGDARDERRVRIIELGSRLQVAYDKRTETCFDVSFSLTDRMLPPHRS